MPRLVYLDQNAWVALAKGSWNKERFREEHSALTQVVGMVRSGSVEVPLSFGNIYETMKINVRHRRANIARAQALISGGTVFRSRRRILGETLAAYIAGKHAIDRPTPPPRWFLSDLWLEAAEDCSTESYGDEISDRVLEAMRQDPARLLFDFLAFEDEEMRIEAVRRYSAGSADLIARIESRRALVAREALALRKRAYGAQLTLDELDFIFATARGLGLDLNTVADIGSSFVRSIVVDVPVFDVERELVVKLEDQGRVVTENDLRDMMAFVTVLPFADVIVAEKQFVNLARQARLDERYGTTLLTSVHQLADGP